MYVLYIKKLYLSLINGLFGCHGKVIYIKYVLVDKLL